jgi:hypothetical protein
MSQPLRGRRHGTGKESLQRGIDVSLQHNYTNKNNKKKILSNQRSAESPAASYNNTLLYDFCFCYPFNSFIQM